ncbi:extracellular solute-binding protein [Clostridium sp. MSJ-4]|uniref:Extracellular solute-binding protein n=1 Tax=Clostridium simiarum TaxID=2841506 RepID=A0ABS6EW58_9CLOT|nr:extracellular solute-binding protein [Clostridium simiarum]MBU5590462.1 extracellular solute-binding protein [Clostridium simiarum]
MKKDNRKLIGKIYSGLIYFILYIPIIILILFSFNESKLNATWTGFTFKWYQKLLTNNGLLVAVKNSLVIAFISSIISVIIGTLTAVGIYKSKFKGKSVMDGMLYIPIVIPEIVLGIALLAFFSLIDVDRGILTLIIAHITFSISYVVVVVRARLEGFDKSIEEAAMDLGATPFQTFLKVTLPSIMPGVIAGGLLAFTLSIDDVIISFFVAGPSSMTFPLKVFSMVKFGVTPEINALSSILILLTVIVVIVAEKIKSSSIKNKNMKRVFAALMSFIFIFTFGVWKASKSTVQYVGELNIFNWSDYIPKPVIEEFERRYNVKVNYATYGSNEEMLAKMMAGGNSYDVVVAADYMVDIMRKQDMLQRIDTKALANWGNIGEEFKHLYFDENDEYSVPYMRSEAIIVVDSTKISDEDIKGFKDLWKDEFKDSIVMLDDPRGVIGMTLKSLGYNFNETDVDKLNEAKLRLKALQPNIKAYDSDNSKSMLISREVPIGVAWSAEAGFAMAENKDLKVVIPEEGLFLQQDNFIVPKNAKNSKEAELFLNFILEADVSIEFTKAYPYTNCNEATYDMTPKEILESPLSFPPEEELKKGDYLMDIGEAVKYYDIIWSEIKN